MPHATVGAAHPRQALRDVIAERCFGPDSPPLHGGDDAREALRDLVCENSGHADPPADNRTTAL